jgi:hypothetical protein
LLNDEEDDRIANEILFIKIVKESNAELQRLVHDNIFMRAKNLLQLKETADELKNAQSSLRNNVA